MHAYSLEENQNFQKNYTQSWRISNHLCYQCYTLKHWKSQTSFDLGSCKQRYCFCCPFCPVSAVPPAHQAQALQLCPEPHCWPLQGLWASPAERVEVQRDWGLGAILLLRIFSSPVFREESFSSFLYLWGFKRTRGGREPELGF